jgi:hypothetical protein
VGRGSDWDTWDLEIRRGTLGAVRLLMAHEDHDGGRQLVRFRLWPRPWRAAWIGAPFAALALVAGALGAGVATAVLGAIAALIALRGFADCAMATGAVQDACTISTVGPRVLTAPAGASGAKEAA